MDKKLSSLLESQAKKLDIPHIKMFSGAGHDSQIIASISPAAMIFVSSKEGISHSPEEYTDEKSILKGMQILREAVYHAAYSE
jgi:acetylornithine deacetylase/succinyl-diaminopimelate desuccinylase-like protein